MIEEGNTFISIICSGSMLYVATAVQPLTLRVSLLVLKGKENPCFNSCIVISVFTLDILSIKKATEYRNNC